MKQCKTCKNVYEEDKYPTCPYCSGQRQVVTTPLPSPGAGFGMPVPMNGGQEDGALDDVTVMGSFREAFSVRAGGNNGGFPETQAVDPVDVSDIGPTEIHIPGRAQAAPDPSGMGGGTQVYPPEAPLPEEPVAEAVPAAAEPAAEDRAAEIPPLDPDVVFSDSLPDDSLPVRGWLVVTKGNGLGRDFRLHDAANIIGRSVRCDIDLDFDGQVRQESAIVTYDDKNGRFYISCHPFTKNNVYLNQEILLAPAVLHDYDVVELGGTELTFRSFCGGGFRY